MYANTLMGKLNLHTILRPPFFYRFCLLEEQFTVGNVPGTDNSFMR